MWPSISKWTYTCQKNLRIQVWKYLAFDLAFLTFVDLFKILLRSLRSKKSGGMQESCKLAFYHQKQFSLKISHFGPVWYVWKHRNGSAIYYKKWALSKTAAVTLIQNGKFSEKTVFDDRMPMYMIPACHQTSYTSTILVKS